MLSTCTVRSITVYQTAARVFNSLSVSEQIVDFVVLAFLIRKSIKENYHASIFFLLVTTFN